MGTPNRIHARDRPPSITVRLLSLLVTRFWQHFVLAGIIGLDLPFVVMEADFFLERPDSENRCWPGGAIERDYFVRFRLFIGGKCTSVLILLRIEGFL